MARLALPLALTLSACIDKGNDTGGAPDLDTQPGDGGDDACAGGTAPVISDGPICGYPGLDTYESEEAPTISFSFKASDDDRDLDVYEITLFIEDDGDGSLDPASASVVNGSPQTASDDGPCTLATLDLTQTLFLQSGSVTYDAPYDWGLMVTDRNGYDSDVAVVTCYTPKADGTEGGTR